MKLIQVTVSIDDVNGIAADNDIPEEEWNFAVQRVIRHRMAITEAVKNEAMRLVQNVVLVDRP